MQKKVRIIIAMINAVAVSIVLTNCSSVNMAPVDKAAPDSLSVAKEEQLRLADSMAAAVMPHFPWPPPKASAFTKIPRNMLVKPGESKTLKQVTDALEQALSQAGYSEVSYYWVPNGFAIVSRLEQINKDGSPCKGNKRWAVNYKNPEVFSLASYLKALFSAQPGYFRVISFILTSESFAQSQAEMSKGDATALVNNGDKNVQKQLGAFPFGENYYCTALIYEFEQKTANSKVFFSDPSQVAGKDHLEKSKIWEGLQHE